MKTNHLNNSKKANSHVKKSPVLFRKIISGVSVTRSNKIYSMSGALVHQPDREEFEYVLRKA
jgi:hypothetical protein